MPTVLDVPYLYFLMGKYSGQVYMMMFACCITKVFRFIRLEKVFVESLHLNAIMSTRWQYCMLPSTKFRYDMISAHISHVAMSIPYNRMLIVLKIGRVYVTS